MHIINRIKIHATVIVLVLIVVVLCYQNYKPETILSGWDTLHPEFNFGLYFSRIINGVWQTHQGLGAVASQAHAGEFPKVILLFLLSFVFPLNMVRYMLFFITLFVGPVGTYYFLQKRIFTKKTSVEPKSYPFIGALFYLLNLGTLQIYYLPFEMFALYYALLPWLLLFAINFLETGKRKQLQYFAAITFLAMPIAHTPTLYYSFFLILLAVVFFYKILHKQTPTTRCFHILIVSLIINSPWLLPHLYFIATSSNAVAISQIHRMFSERAFLTSREFGNIHDIVLLKNFYFDWGKLDFTTREFTPIFKDWKLYLTYPFITVIGYILVSVQLVGLICGLVVKENRKTILLLIPSLVIPIIFIGNNIIPFNYMFDIVSFYVPLIKEWFRFPFTKFSTPLIFVFSVLIAQGSYEIVSWSKKKFSITMGSIVLCVIGLALVMYMLPAFRGNLISPSMRVQPPEEYFQLFKFFDKEKKDQRIASFPINNYWNWTYYSWGYEGTGFLWFGIQQPLLDREFDRWNGKNENYYWEISYTTYSQNLPLLEKVLEKYQVSWLLVDANVISPDSPKSLYLDKFDDLLSQSQKITLAQTFGNIKVYRVQLPYQTQNFIFTVQNPAQVAPLSAWNNDDRAYADNGTYFSYTDNQAPTTENQVYYPFRSLFTGRKQEELEFAIQDTKDILVIRPKNNVEVNDQLTLETGKPDELLEIDRTDLSKMTIVRPKLFINGALVEGPAQVSIANLSSLWVEVPKVTGYLSYESSKDDNLMGKTPVRCDTFRNGPIKRQPISGDGKELLRFSSIDSSNCMDIDLPNLPQDKSYIIAIDSRNIKGKSLLLSVINKNSRKSDIETYLPENNKSQNVSTSYFVLPPMEQFGAGYTLHFDNISIGDDEVVNDLGAIAVYQFPYSMLKGIVFTSTQSPANQQMLVLSQSYDEGWKAYSVTSSKLRVTSWLNNAFPFLFGEELKNHVLVNNWANGWVLPKAETQISNLKDQNLTQIKIIYLPQYLEYVGFGLLFITAAVILFPRKHLKRKQSF